MIHLLIAIALFVSAIGGLPLVVRFKHDGPSCQCTKCRAYRERRHAHTETKEQS